jgi:HD-GYP domain-containing protein (c-di-GMP phosphodiesterase class II)
MQFVAAKDIREGMCTAQDVCDSSGRILISRGQRIGDHHIIRLRKFGIGSIFIDENNGEAVAPPSRSELRDQCVQVLSSSYAKLGQEFAAKKVTLDGAAIKAASDHIIEALLKSKNPLVTLLDVSTSSDRLMQHSVNATVLATVLAIDLRVPDTMLKDLAVAMLFHDIGMIFLPEEVTQKSSQLTQSDVTTLCKHPQLGFEHLVRSEAIGGVAANIVWRHHELMDGSGYPQRLTEDKLSVLVRIATVAEVYDSLTSSRFGQPAFMPDAAISFLIGHAGKQFAKEIVLALCKHVALYPKGSAVQLNTGECGVVAGVLPTAPTRPVILVQTDNQGKPFKEPVVVDLTCDTRRAVARSAPSIAMLIAKDGPPVSRPVDPIYAHIG